jgi:hypothetical protein
MVVVHVRTALSLRERALEIGNFANVERSGKRWGKPIPRLSKLIFMNA